MVSEGPGVSVSSSMWVQKLAPHLPKLRTEGPVVEANHVFAKSFTVVARSHAPVKVKTFEEPLQNKDNELARYATSWARQTSFHFSGRRSTNHARVGMRSITQSCVASQACSPCTDNNLTGNHEAPKLSWVCVCVRKAWRWRHHKAFHAVPSRAELVWRSPASARLCCFRDCLVVRNMSHDVWNAVADNLTRSTPVPHG